MFIKRQQYPSIEFSPEEGQQAPTLVHYFSDRGDPFKSVLPLLIEEAEDDAERVFVVESPLAEVVNWTIELHKHPDLPLVDLEKRYLVDVVPKLATSSARMYKSDIKHLLKSFADAPLSQIKPMHIRNFLEDHDDKPTTANRCKRVFESPRIS